MAALDLTEEELCLESKRDFRAHLAVERIWQEKIGAALQKLGYEVELERRVANGRVDISIPNYAIEVDWAPKWAESIGQALYYSLCTKSKPVSLLLIEYDNAVKFVEVALKIAKNNRPRLQVWTVDTRTGEFNMDGDKIMLE